LKSITVYTNDPVNPQLTLRVKGAVKDFVSISPKRVRMTGAAGDEISSNVTIIPHKEYPFKILEAKPLQEGNIKVEMEEVNKEGKTSYQLTVLNLKNERTRYFDTIVVKTDSKIRPELKISVYGNILEKPEPAPDKQVGSVKQSLPEVSNIAKQPAPAKN